MLAAPCYAAAHRSKLALLAPSPNVEAPGTGWKPCPPVLDLPPKLTGYKVYVAMRACRSVRAQVPLMRFASFRSCAANEVSGVFSRGDFSLHTQGTNLWMSVRKLENPPDMVHRNRSVATSASTRSAAIGMKNLRRLVNQRDLPAFSLPLSPMAAFHTIAAVMTRERTLYPASSARSQITLISLG